MKILNATFACFLGLSVAACSGAPETRSSEAHSSTEVGLTTTALELDNVP